MCVYIYMCVCVHLFLSLCILGSTDIISCSVHGVRHPITAALHIILGMDRQPDRHKDRQTHLALTCVWGSRIFIKYCQNA